MLTAAPRSITARRIARIAIRVLALAVIFATMPRVRAGTFPGVNGKIAFVGIADSNSEIYVMDADGTNLTRLTTNTIPDSLPSWSPDGRQIAFVSQRDGGIQEVYVMNADGTNQTRVTTSGGTTPSWSPDGRIVYANILGLRQILVINADGTGQTSLTNAVTHPNGVQFPAWSPDGTKVAYIYRDGLTRNDPGAGVYVMNADGTNQRRLTTRVLSDLGPLSWSPDSLRIAYRCVPDSDLGTAEVCAVGADGSGDTNLTNTHNVDFSSTHPSWSPDGRFIAFETLRGATPPRISQIYVMNADGTGQVSLTHDLQGVYQPAWQTVPETPPGGGGTGGGGGGTGPAPNTPIGFNVPVVLPPSPPPPATPVPPIATLTFSHVTQPGETDLTIRAVGPPPPEGFALGTPPTYFDFTTTATFEGTIRVCIDYSALVVHDPASLHLFHYEPPSNTPVDSTVSNDQVNKIICGDVTSLSPFAVLEPEQPAILPWSALTVTATIDPRKGDFDLRGIFTVGEGSDGIDVLKEDMLVQIGPFTATIPAGAFRRHGFGKNCDFFGRGWGTRWRRARPRRFGQPPRGFEARMHAVHLEAHLRPLGQGGRYAFEISGRDADLEDITNPVTVGIVVGNDGGSTQITARFPPPPRDRWRDRD